MKFKSLESRRGAMSTITWIIAVIFLLLMLAFYIIAVLFLNQDKIGLGLFGKTSSIEAGSGYFQDPVLMNSLAAILNTKCDFNGFSGSVSDCFLNPEKVYPTDELRAGFAKYLKENIFSKLVETKYYAFKFYSEELLTFYNTKNALEVTFYIYSENDNTHWWQGAYALEQYDKTTISLLDGDSSFELYVYDVGSIPQVKRKSDPTANPLSSSENPLDREQVKKAAEGKTPPIPAGADASPTSSGVINRN